MYTINKGGDWLAGDDLLIKHRASRLVTPWLAIFFIFEGLSRVGERDKMVKKVGRAHLGIFYGGKLCLKIVRFCKL
jgi:hypothetical protein